VYPRQQNRIICVLIRQGRDSFNERAESCSETLEPDPVTAPVATWMFAQRLAGHSAARITQALNDAAIRCPSAADPGGTRTAPVPGGPCGRYGHPG
jgi:hypothetical protein